MLETKEVISILEKWSSKYKKSIDCSNPKGFSQRAHCAGRRKRKRGGKTKSRPVESFTENRMDNLKEFFINEVNDAVRKEMAKKNLKESSKDLFEAVNLHTKLKKESATEKKIELSERAVELAELKVLEGYDELNGACDCGEGEGRMLKGQLLSLMANAEKLYHMISEEDQFEDWVQAKITIVDDYMSTIAHFIEYRKMTVGNFDMDDKSQYNQTSEEDLSQYNDDIPLL